MQVICVQSPVAALLLTGSSPNEDNSAEFASSYTNTWRKEKQQWERRKLLQQELTH